MRLLTNARASSRCSKLSARSAASRCATCRRFRRLRLGEHHRDPVHGTGHLADADIARVVRTGVAHDGRLASPMPAFPRLSDRDLIAIVAFLRSDDPLVRAVPRPKTPARPSLLGKAMAHLVSGRSPILQPRSLLRRQPIASRSAGSSRSIASIAINVTRRASSAWTTNGRSVLRILRRRHDAHVGERNADLVGQSDTRRGNGHRQVDGDRFRARATERLPPRPHAVALADVDVSGDDG